MKRVVIASIVVLFMIAVIAVGYFYYQQYQTPGSESYSAIPGDVSLILEIKNGESIIEKLNTNAQWNQLKSNSLIKELSQSLLQVDSLKLANTETSEWLQTNPVIISFHATKSTDFDLLYIIKMPQFKQESFINEFIYNLAGENFKIDKRIYNGVSIREFNYQSKQFAYAVYQGLFLASHTPILVEDAIRQIKSGMSIKNDKSFKKVYQAAGKNVDAHLYINYKNLPRFVSIYTNSVSDGSVGRIKNFAGWTQFDIDIKKESLLMNGFTIANDSTHYLYAFKNQQPVSPTVYNILPKRTALFQLVGLSDPSDYFRKLYTSNIVDLEKSNINIENRSKLTSWIGNEICYFITESNSVNYSNNIYIAIKASDIGQARKALKEYGEKSNAGGFKEELYRGKIIGFINEEKIIPQLFGDKYEKLTRFFYTYLDDFVIVANQASSIRTVIDDHLAGRKLSGDESFSSFQKKLSNTVNFYSYINISRSAYIIKSYTKTDFTLPENDLGYVNKFNAVALQISNNDNLFHTSVSFDTGDKVYQPGVNLLWATQLDTSVSMQPYIVLNHNTNTNEIAVQDDLYKLYLIDNSGQILWKKLINEKIISPIYQVDLFKNGKLQMMFNTATRLHLVDRAGNDVGNYPIRLPADATAAMALFDYENNKDYRIFIPCANEQVYSYLASGKPSAGWLFNKKAGSIVNPVQHFNIGGKDYLVVSNREGKFFILDRRGVVRAEAKQEIFRPVNSKVYLQKDENNRSYFVTTDTTGTIFSVFPDGTVYSKTVTPFSPSHYFILEDINSDQVNDYIYLDDNKIFVYNRDNYNIFTYNFSNSVINSARFYPFSNGKGKVGTASVSANEIYLINDDGSMYEGFPLKGSTEFLIEDLNKDGSKKVITASNDGNVYIYNFE